MPNVDVEKAKVRCYVNNLINVAQPTLVDIELNDIMNIIYEELLDLRDRAYKSTR